MQLRQVGQGPTSWRMQWLHALTAPLAAQDLPLQMLSHVRGERQVLEMQLRDTELAALLALAWKMQGRWRQGCWAGQQTLAQQEHQQ